MRIVSNTVKAFTDTSADTASLGLEGGYVLLTPTTTCHIAFRKEGDTTAATVNDMPLFTANVAYGPFKFEPNEHIAVIRAATNGNLHVTHVIPQDYD